MATKHDAIQLSHLEQTIYFASQRQGINLLDADVATRLVDDSLKRAVNLLSSMARKGALCRVGRGRCAHILVDALRFELGRELTEQLQPSPQATPGAALSSLPSVTSPSTPPRRSSADWSRLCLVSSS